MKSLLLMAAVTSLAGATGALAQSNSAFRLPSPDSTESFARPDFSLRIGDVFDSDGSRRQKRSIIAGMDVAPGTTVGVGLFDTMPKAKGSGADPRLDARAKKSRKAALGMSLRF